MLWERAVNPVLNRRKFNANWDKIFNKTIRKKVKQPCQNSLSSEMDQERN